MKRIPEQIWIFAGAYLFFLLTLAENFSGPHDSITYLNGIVDGYPLVNQHHLLYHYAAWCWLHLWQPLFPGVRDYYIIESFSSLWGAASVAVCYSFFRNRFHFNRGQSLLAVLIIVFSYGFWFYSVNIEVYAPPLFFILLALYYLSKSTLTVSDWWKVFLLHCLAIVFHQVNVLFLPVIIWRLWTHRQQYPFIQWLARYAALGVVIVVGSYFIVGWVVEGQNSMEKWVRWMQGYSRGGVFWYPLSSKTPVDITYGFSHALLGGHYILKIPLVYEAIGPSLASHSLGDELYIAHNISATTAWILGALTVFLVLVIFWLTVRFIRNFKAIHNRYRSIVGPLLLTFAIYSLFFTFWMPEILEFWLLQSVILWVLLIGTSTIKPLPASINLTILSATCAFVLFCINYFGSMQWMQSKENDFYYVKARTIEQTAKPDDIVLMQDGWIIKDFLWYFTKVNAHAVPSRDSSWKPVDSLVTRTLTRSGKIFILPEVNNMLQAPGTEYLDSLRREYPDRLKLFRQKEPEIWVIE